MSERPLLENLSLSKIQKRQISGLQDIRKSIKVTSAANCCLILSSALFYALPIEGHFVISFLAAGLSIKGLGDTVQGFLKSAPQREALSRLRKQRYADKTSLHDHARTLIDQTDLSDKSLRSVDKLLLCALTDAEIATLPEHYQRHTYHMQAKLCLANLIQHHKEPTLDQENDFILFDAADVVNDPSLSTETLRKTAHALLSAPESASIKQAFTEKQNQEPASKLSRIAPLALTSITALSAVSLLTLSGTAAVSTAALFSAKITAIPYTGAFLSLFGLSTYAYKKQLPKAIKRASRRPEQLKKLQNSLKILP